MARSSSDEPLGADLDGRKEQPTCGALELANLTETLSRLTTSSQQVPASTLHFHIAKHDSLEVPSVRERSLSTSNLAIESSTTPLVKPLEVAFRSTGILSRKGFSNNRKHTPDTPIKKHQLLSSKNLSRTADESNSPTASKSFGSNYQKNKWGGSHLHSHTTSSLDTCSSPTCDDSPIVFSEVTPIRKNSRFSLSRNDQAQGSLKFLGSDESLSSSKRFDSIQNKSTTSKSSTKGETRAKNIDSNWTDECGAHLRLSLSLNTVENDLLQGRKRSPLKQSPLKPNKRTANKKFTDYRGISSNLEFSSENDLPEAIIQRNTHVGGMVGFFEEDHDTVDFPSRIPLPKRNSILNPEPRIACTVPSREFIVLDAQRSKFGKPNASGSQPAAIPKRGGHCIRSTTLIESGTPFDSTFKSRQATQHIPYSVLFSRQPLFIDQVFFKAAEGCRQSLTKLLAIVSSGTNMPATNTMSSANSPVNQMTYFETFGNQKKIGEGMFGLVYHAIDPVSGASYAIKKSRNVFIGYKDAMQSMNEVQILLALQTTRIPKNNAREWACEQIVGFKNGWIQNGFLFLMLEYCDGGDLKMYLDLYYQQQCEVLPDNQIWFIMKQLCMVHYSLIPGA